MISPTIICYANSKPVLFNLKFGIIQVFGDATPVISCTDEDTLSEIIAAENQKGIETEFILLSIDQVKNHAEFINRILRLASEATVLITGNSQDLLNIQADHKNNPCLHFLPGKYDADSFELAVRMIISSRNSIKKLKELENNDSHIEEKVNESLQKLIDANMAKDQFLSIIAHDLKSPFNALLGIADILLNDWENLEEEYKLELISDIRRTSQDTYKLLINLLEWTKGQKEKLKLTIKEVNVRELVESAMKISQNHANVKGIKVNNEISVDLKVNTDEQMIATVFRNLISNAVQYIQPGGNIKITAREEEKYTTFCISDNGQGIEKSYIHEYFSKENSKKLKGNASAFKGLGLIICKDFIEKNGGRIWLETQIGEGSKFFFTLPN